MTADFSQSVPVFSLFILSIVIIVTVKLILLRRKDSFYRSRNLLLYSLYLLKYFCIGFFSFGIPSAIQKLIIGVSLHMRGFVAPLIVGGSFGIIVGILFYNLRRKNIILQQTIAHSRYNVKRYRKLFDMLPYGADLINKDGIITDCSKGSLNLLGYEENEYIGHSIFRFLHPEDREILENRLKDVMEGKNGKVLKEIRLKKKDGDYLVILRSSALLETEDHVPYMLCMNTDITRLREYEKEKESLSKQLEHAQRLEAIGTLAGGIAHDFNNILLPIMGYCDLLLDSLPEKSGEVEMVKAICQAGSRARDLTGQILQFSRHSDPEQSVFNLNDLLEEVLKLSRAAIPAEIELKLETEGERNLIFASPSQLHQVCMNLITNAYHALPGKGGVIGIRLRRFVLPGDILESRTLPDGNYVQLTIWDNGSGIAPEIREKILEPFFTTKEPGKGTGMGLSIAYGIVKQIRGDLLIESEVGSGSEISLLLPLSADDIPDKMEKKKKTEGSREQGKILLVDDETMIIDLLSTMLNTLGYETTSATDSRKALKLIKSDDSRFDLVLTDISMPGLTGLDLATAIRASNPGIPIILSTGYSDKLNDEVLEDLRISAVLTKPYKMKELAEVLKKLLP